MNTTDKMIQIVQGSEDKRGMIANFVLLCLYDIRSNGNPHIEDEDMNTMIEGFEFMAGVSPCPEDFGLSASDFALDYSDGMIQYEDMRPEKVKARDEYEAALEAAEVKGKDALALFHEKYVHLFY